MLILIHNLPEKPGYRVCPDIFDSLTDNKISFVVLHKAVVSCFLHKQDQASPGKESFYLKLRIPLCKPCYIKYIKAPYREYFN